MFGRKHSTVKGFLLLNLKSLPAATTPIKKLKKVHFRFSRFFDKKPSQAFYAELKKQFGITALSGSLMQRDKELWLFPEEFAAIENKIKYARS